MLNVEPIRSEEEDPHLYASKEVFELDFRPRLAHILRIISLI